MPNEVKDVENQAGFAHENLEEVPGGTVLTLGRTKKKWIITNKQAPIDQTQIDLQMPSVPHSGSAFATSTFRTGADAAPEDKESGYTPVSDQIGRFQLYGHDQALVASLNVIFDFEGHPRGKRSDPEGRKKVEEAVQLGSNAITGFKEVLLGAPGNLERIIDIISKAPVNEQVLHETIFNMLRTHHDLQNVTGFFEAVLTVRNKNQELYNVHFKIGDTMSLKLSNNQFETVLPAIANAMTGTNPPSMLQVLGKNEGSQHLKVKCEPVIAGETIVLASDGFTDTFDMAPSLAHGNHPILREYSIVKTRHELLDAEENKVEDISQNKTAESIKKNFLQQAEDNRQKRLVESSPQKILLMKLMAFFDPDPSFFAEEGKQNLKSTFGKILRLNLGEPKNIEQLVAVYNEHQSTGKLTDEELILLKTIAENYQRSQQDNYNNLREEIVYELGICGQHHLIAPFLAENKDEGENVVIPREVAKSLRDNGYRALAAAFEKECYKQTLTLGKMYRDSCCMACGDFASVIICNPSAEFVNAKSLKQIVLSEHRAAQDNNVTLAMQYARAAVLPIIEILDKQIAENQSKRRSGFGVSASQVQSRDKCTEALIDARDRLVGYSKNVRHGFSISPKVVFTEDFSSFDGKKGKSTSAINYNKAQMAFEKVFRNISINTEALQPLRAEDAEERKAEIDKKLLILATCSYNTLEERSLLARQVRYLKKELLKLPKKAPSPNGPAVDGASPPRAAEKAPSPAESSPVASAQPQPSDEPTNELPRPSPRRQ